jgi:hypothetical protein
VLDVIHGVTEEVGVGNPESEKVTGVLLLLVLTATIAKLPPAPGFLNAVTVTPVCGSCVAAIRT